ncbi:MAG: cystathionine gamma-lyase [Pseudomonadota bacterium]
MTDDGRAGAKRMFRSLHHRSQTLAPGDALAPPMVTASKFVLGAGPDAGIEYGRFSSPTWEHVEAQLACLEDAPVVAFPSGMAACAAAIYTLLKPGDRVLVPSDGYYTVRMLIDRYLTPLGVEAVQRPTRALGEAPMEGVRLVWIETPSNPGLDVCDIAAVAVRAKAAGAITVADNTTATAFLQRPLDLGVDLAVYSDTKAAAGHSDVLFGHVAGRDAGVIEAVRDWRRINGVIPGAFEAWLVSRGLETLDVRLERMCANAAALAEAVRDHPALESVRYPGLPDDPSHALAAHQMDAFGFLIGMTFRSQRAAEDFVAASEAVSPTTSFGGVQTTADRRARWGDAAPEGYLRLSAGCEPTGPLVADILAALDAIA